MFNSQNKLASIGPPTPLRLADHALAANVQREQGDTSEKHVEGWKNISQLYIWYPISRSHIPITVRYSATVSFASWQSRLPARWKWIFVYPEPGTPSKTLNNQFSFHIRYYINCLAIQLLITKNIIKKYKPKIIRISTLSNKELMIRYDSIFSFLLKDFLKKKNIKLILKIQFKKTDKKSRIFFVKSILSYILNYFTQIVNSIFYNVSEKH